MNGSCDESSKSLTRRNFVKVASASGAALCIGLAPFERPHRRSDARPTASTFAPNQWLRIDSNGAVTIMAARSEMGQGVRTSLPMIVAEELGADWSRVTVEHARPGAAFPEMRTSGSGSVTDSWGSLRAVAAVARVMLLQSAAAIWQVNLVECAAERGVVVHARSGRRLPFGALVARAAALPIPAQPALKPSNTFTLLGTRVARVDGPSIVSGRAVFGLDVRVPNMRYATIARSPQFGGKVKRYTDTRTRAVPGVSHVVPIPTGLAVIADRTWAAMRGREMLEVEWDTMPAPEGNSAAYLKALDDAIGQGKRARRDGGDVDRALAAASRTMEATYRTSFQGHAAMEPLNCVASVHDGQCEVWVGTQAPNQVQEGIAKQLGIAADRVTVNVMLMGGGFGRRLDVDYVLEAVEVSRAIGAPVQVVWTREDDMRFGMYQPAQVNQLTAALDTDGRPTAWRHRVADYNLTMFGAYDPAFDPAADGDPWGGFDTPYSFPALDVTLALLKAPVPTGAWRSVSYPASVFARESFLDEIAHATTQDPLALRLALIASPGTIRRGALDLHNGDRLRAVLQLAAARAGWSEPFEMSRDGRRWGRGIACNAYHNRTMVAQVAEVSVGTAGDIRVHRVVCAVDCGQVINRSGLEGQFEGGVIWALSAALKGSITFADGQTQQRNFSDFPVLRTNEAPMVETHVITSALPPFGVGEQPVPAVAPAVMNAVFAATGKRIRNLPALSL